MDHWRTHPVFRFYHFRPPGIKTKYMPHKSPLGVGLAFYIPGLLSRSGSEVVGSPEPRSLLLFSYPLNIDMDVWPPLNCILVTLSRRF